MTLPFLALFLGLFAQPRVETREERVLAMLRELEHEAGSFRYLDATFAPWKQDGRGPGQLVASYFIFCSTSSREIDDARFRELGLRTLRIYGLEPERDATWSDARVLGRIDGLDVRTQIGFELRGRSAPETRVVITESETDFLDDQELAHLRSSGVRLFVAESARYTDDDDGFTPALAFVADLVRFLNGVTEGEDVDLGGLLFEREASWVWPLQPVDGMRVESGRYGPVLLVDRAVTVTIPCSGWADFGPPRGRSHSPLAGGAVEPRAPSTRGAPSVVVVHFAITALDEGAPRPAFRVRYRQSHGRSDELVHETSSMVAFLPSAFDLAQPFVLELELSPGRYSIHGGAARIGAAASAGR